LLAGLLLSAGPITPAFASNITTYGAIVSHADTSVNVTPTSADSTATIQVGAAGWPLNVVPSGQASGPLALNVGLNGIDVKVTAQDGIATTTYSLLVLRPGPPAVTTLPASALTANAATLNAMANPNGAATTAFFHWGADANYGNTTGPVSLGDGTASVAIHTAIGGLLPGMTYHYAVTAANSVSTVTGADATFTTPAAAPTATTLPASAVTASSAALNGSITPNGAATTVNFQWGTDTNYGNSTPQISGGSGNSPVGITATIGNLLPGTTYHFSVIVSNSVAVVTGSDQTLTTPAMAPLATTLPASSVTAGHAT